MITAGSGAAVLAGYQQMSSAEKNAAKKEEGRLLALGMDRQHARTAAVIAAAASSGEHSAGAAAVLNALGGSLNSSVVVPPPQSRHRLQPAAEELWHQRLLQEALRRVSGLVPPPAHWRRISQHAPVPSRDPTAPLHHRLTQVCRPLRYAWLLKIFTILRKVPMI